MHFCTARIAIAGDHQNVYSATEFDPISWPEIAVLQYLHGDQSITEVVPFAVAAQTSREERSRLAEKYKLFIGSTANKVLRALPVPMVVVPRDYQRVDTFPEV